MGVKGLWSLLEPVANPVTLESLEGHCLAVDISLWIYQASCGYSDHQLDAAKNAHLSLILRRLAKLLFYKIKPVFVFDGKNIPIFKRKLLRNRQIKKYVEELTMTKAQKRALERLAASQNAESNEVSVDLKQFNGLSKRRNDESDLFDISKPSTSRLDDATEDSQSSFDSLKSTEFDCNELHNLESYDAKLDYLTTVRDHIRCSLRPQQIPDDANEFCDFQLTRLLKRNRINEQLDALKQEAIKTRFNRDGQSVSDQRIKMAVMEGRDRGHFIYNDSDIEIEGCSSANPAQSSHSIYRSTEEEDDEDETLQEAIYASVSRKFVTSPRDEYEGADSRINFWSETSSDTGSFIDVIDEIVDTEKFQKSDPNMTKNVKVNVAHAKELEKNDDWTPDYVKETAGNIDRKEQTDIKTAESEYFNDLSEGIYGECQELLRICGIPFVIAPGEAEAQCCELERLGLVKGVISDDSDSWLFGATKVLKNMFNQKKRLHSFTKNDIEKQLGISRWEMIQIAMLSGGDYSEGLEGIGVVSALELISEFASRSQSTGKTMEEEAFENLSRISDWLNQRGSNDGTNIDKMNQISSSKDSISGKNPCIKNAKILKLRQTIEKNNLSETLELFPSREVFNAYTHPLVNDSAEKFRWGTVNMQDLERLVWQKLGWNDRQLIKHTNGSLQKWNEHLSSDNRSIQSHITSYMYQLHKSGEDQRLQSTSRVQAALSRLMAHKSNSTIVENDQKCGVEDCSSQGSVTKTQRSAKPRASRNSSNRAGTSRQQPVERKRPPKPRKTKRPMKKTMIIRSNEFDGPNLSEKSSSSGIDD